MPECIKGHISIQRYQQMVDKLYCQPKREIMVGCFVGKNMELNNSKPPKAKKKKAAKKKEKSNGCKDIRYFFSKWP